MADMERLERALRNAHSAGDEAAARKLAAAIREMRQTPAPEAAPAPAQPPAPSAMDQRYTGGIYGDGTGLLARAGRFLGASADAVGSGALFGFDDEANAALQTAGGLAGNFEERRAALDAQKQSRRETDPVASLAGEVAGGLASGGTAARAGLTTAGRAVPRALGGRVGGAALEGAGYGALYGAGEAAPGERTQGAAQGAAFGALTGGALEGVGRGLSRVMAQRNSPVAPAAQQLADDANRLYEASRQAGVTIKAPAFDRVAQNMELAAGRINRDLRANTAGIVEDVKALRGKPITLEELDELRQVIGQSMKRAEPQDVRTLTRMKDIIDNFADNVKPSDITGDIKGFEFIKEGRALWARKSKVDALNEVIEKAQNQATGFENGLVIQMRSLANNKRRLSQFSPEEQRMIKDVVRRGSARGILRAIGMLSPNSTFGGLMTGGVGVGAGIVPGALLAGTGMAARSAAGAMTNARMQALQQAVASGVVPRQAMEGVAGPFIGGGVAAIEGTRRTLSDRPQR